MERDTKTKTIKVPRESSDEWTIEFREATKGRGERVAALTPNGLVHSVFAGEWEASLLPNTPLPEPVRVAAEELYWGNKTLAENEFRDNWGGLWQFRDPSFDSLSYRVFFDSGWTWATGALGGDGDLGKAALAWHRKAYTLAPDEARDERGMPIKMADDEVRDGRGLVEKMEYMPTFDDVSFDHYCSLKTFRETTAKLSEYHPCRDPSQLARVVAFWEASRAKGETPRPAEWEGYSVMAYRELGSADVKMILRGKGGRIHDEDIAPLLGKRIRITVLGEEEE